MAGEVKSENYIVIQGWMINELEIKGNELVVYAIIYGFTQTEGQIFNGSLQYLANWTKSTKQGVSKNLKSLVEKGYIVKNDKYINGVKFCEYYATKVNRVCNKVDGGMQQSLIGGVQQSLTNNISLDNTSNNKKNNKEKEYLSPLGEFKNVLLTEEELKKIKDQKLNNYIDDLSLYLENNPKKKYASHYATIITWSRRDKNKPNASNSYKRKEIVPEWLSKDIEAAPITEEEQTEMDEILNKYKESDFETRKEKLQAKLKEKYKK